MERVPGQGAIGVIRGDVGRHECGMNGPRQRRNGSGAERKRRNGCRRVISRITCFLSLSLSSSSLTPSHASEEGIHMRGRSGLVGGLVAWLGLVDPPYRANQGQPGNREGERGRGREGEREKERGRRERYPPVSPSPRLLPTQPAHHLPHPPPNPPRAAPCPLSSALGWGRRTLSVGRAVGEGRFGMGDGGTEYRG